MVQPKGLQQRRAILCLGLEQRSHGPVSPGLRGFLLEKGVCLKVLFVHQNFPAQFKFLAPALARLGHQVHALTAREVDLQQWEGVQLKKYRPLRGSAAEVHPWVRDFETKTIRAEACLRAAWDLRKGGFSPDIIVAHPGWGESLFLKDVWPEARLGIYCEFFYQHEGTDVGFDPEFNPSHPADASRLRLKNLSNFLHFDMAEAGISPTYWQADTFPARFRQKITVVHDGIDTDQVRPDPSVRLSLPDGVSISRESEVITFFNRNLEPYRGYHIFMRALPELLRRRPQARVIVVGGHEVSYGSRPDEKRYGASSWRDVFANEVRPQISDTDWARVHFLTRVPHPVLLRLMQVSSVHVYLTYPFVLSWSLLEAMSAGCAIVASRTGPVLEAVAHDDTGLLVDFFDKAALVDATCGLLDDPARRARLGARAREHARETYDLHSRCLPGQLRWTESLAEAPRV